MIIILFLLFLPSPRRDAADLSCPFPRDWLSAGFYCASSHARLLGHGGIGAEVFSRFLLRAWLLRAGFAGSAGRESGVDPTAHTCSLSQPHTWLHSPGLAHLCSHGGQGRLGREGGPAPEGRAVSEPALRGG